MVDNDPLADHARLVAALRDAAAYAHPVGGVELVETHISSVLLAGDYAYKLKKPVNLGFVDFSTLALRRRYCDEEVRLNRRTAPMLYLDVVPVTRRADGGLRFGGDGEAIEYAVRMRRFDAAAQLDRLALAGGLDAALIDRLAGAIAAFHAACEPAPKESDYGCAPQVRAWTANSLEQLRARRRMRSCANGSTVSRRGAKNSSRAAPLSSRRAVLPASCANVTATCTSAISR
jgi:aminoglycoside phosphotransferase family enzyme